MKKNDNNRFRDEAVEKIEAYINDKKLLPHSKLPSERDLCDMWNFNRTTLRCAIQRLVIEGTLYQKRGSGTFVAEPKLLRNLKDLKSISILAKENGITLTNKVLSMDVLEGNKQIIQKLNLSLGDKVYALTRIRYFDDEAVIIENSFLNYNMLPNLIEKNFESESLYTAIENDYKIHLSRGEETIGIAYATDYEAELLGIEVGQAVFSLTGVVYDDSKIPVEYFMSIIKSNKLSFGSTLIKKKGGYCDENSYSRR